MSFPNAPSLYPIPSEASLKLNYVGKDIADVPAPAAIIDAAVVRRNCKLMLDTVNALGVTFRAHVKTHKTTQLAKLQVGENTRHVRLVVSTIAELENLVPWLLECQQAGRIVSVLYGVPVAPSHIPRLASLARLLGQGAIGVFVDHPDHLRHLISVDEAIWPGQIPVFVKIDAGYHRAGVPPSSPVLDQMSGTLAGQSRVQVFGAYSHMGSSYGSSGPEDALDFFKTELEGAVAGAERLVEAMPALKKSLIVSIGATPTATSLQNLLRTDTAAHEVRKLISKVKEDFILELHAGVYPVLDMQQLATRARPLSINSTPHLNFDALGLRIMVEVASTYDDREKPEALICAGSIVLGREPCKSYSGWGVVTPWQGGGPKSASPIYDPAGAKTGWIVGRISQEHGNLTWEGSQDNLRKLQIGEKVLIWPNHACMAGPSFGWYLVVDSDSKEPEIINDVWVRWRGW